MTFPRPRSLSGLILLGLLLVALPLLWGVVSAALEMTRLSDSSERLVIHGVQATRYSQALVRQVAAMERTARLYQLLGRPELKNAFDENHRRLRTVLDGFASLPEDRGRSELITEIRRRAELIDDGVNSIEIGAKTDVLGEFGPLSRDTGQLSLLASKQIDRELNTLQSQTQRARRRLLWQTGMLVPVTLGLAFLFAFELGRPIRDIDRAIANLGHGRLEEPVLVRGPPTDLEALGRQIEWLRRRLLEVTEERERFLRHVSHELKTPLANIREGSELLTEGAVGPLRGEQREIAGILRDNSLRLQQLIENLLSYSEWQSSMGELDISIFPLAALIRSVTDSHQLQFAARQLKLYVELQDMQIRGDRAKLRLVVDNLVSNAAKFAPDEGVVRVEARANGSDVLIDVTDTGPGISVDDRERVFEPFYQGSALQGGLVPGTGIGLSIVREFVEAHGGRVELVESDGPGAHFRVILPGAAQG